MQLFAGLMRQYGQQQADKVRVGKIAVGTAAGLAAGFGFDEFDGADFFSSVPFSSAAI